MSLYSRAVISQSTGWFIGLSKILIGRFSSFICVYVFIWSGEKHQVLMGCFPPALVLD